MMRSRWSLVLWLVFVGVGLAGRVHADDLAGFEARRLPNATLKVLPNGTDEQAKATLLPMASLFGKPIAVLYWKVGDAKAETELKAFQALQHLPKFKDKLHFLTAVKASSTSEEQAAIKRARELKLSMRLVLDRDQIGPYLEAFYQFPRYGLIDKTGAVKVWHCAHLAEVVGAGMTYLQALYVAAEGKDIPTMRGTAQMSNSHQLVGKPFPDVGLDGVDLKPRTLKTYFTPGRPLLIAFWSATCAHCQRLIPALAKYWNLRRGNIDLLTITRAPSQELREMIVKQQKEKGIEWPVAYAPENATLSFFKIVKVPTVFLIDQKGIVRYVWIQPEDSWIDKVIETSFARFGIF